MARRRVGTASAVASRSPRRAKANSRLRVCERSSCAIATTRGPTRANIRRRWASVSVGEASTSKLASTREAVTFACCPPGPDERLVRTVISENGIVSPVVIGSVRRASSASLNAVAYQRARRTIAGQHSSSNEWYAQRHPWAIQARPIGAAPRRARRAMRSLVRNRV